MRVKKFSFSSGENYSTLLGDDGLPMQHPNLFVMINHRNNSDAATTCHKEFEHIKLLYEICDFVGIDLEERCMMGDFLKKTEMETLVKWSKRTVESFREHVARNRGIKVVELTPKLNKLETARANIVVENEGDISSHTSYSRVTTFANYIGWLEGYLFPSRDGNAENILKSLRPKKFNAKGDTDEEAARVIDLLNGDSSETSQAGNIEELGEPNGYKSLTKNQIVRVLDVVRPDSSENPWDNQGVRFRNQLIIRLLHGLGNRRGELARIRIQDIKTSPENGRKYLHIRENEDREDRRLDKPSAKTLGRHIPLSSKLVALIDEYVVYHRSKVSGAEKLPYLLIPHHPSKSKDTALSLSAINKVCHQISEAVGFRVSPHAFRHSWNDAYSDMADKNIKCGKSTEAKTESDRRKLMGWREGSPMAQRYSKRHDSKRAYQAGLELQEKDIAEIDSIVGSYDEDIPM
ncbi:site-specific integrase [Vibrio parahaemolyticus]